MYLSIVRKLAKTSSSQGLIKMTTLGFFLFSKGVVLILPNIGFLIHLEQNLLRENYISS